MKDISHFDVDTDVFDMVAINATRIKLVSGGKKAKVSMSVFLGGWDDASKITMWRPRGVFSEETKSLTSLKSVPVFAFDKMLHLIPYLRGYATQEIKYLYDDVRGKTAITRVVRDLLKQEYTSDDVYHLSILLRKKNGVWLKTSKTKPLSDLFNANTLTSCAMSSKKKSKSVTKKAGYKNMIGNIEGLSENFKNLI